MEKGKIKALKGSWGSGLATLVIEKDNGETVKVNADNAPLVRALDACFGDVIGAGHTVNTENLKGKEIYFAVDSIGLLEGFAPVED